VGIELDYTKQQVALGGFAAFASAFAASGGAGMNVTVPFKLDAFDFADQHSAAARAAQSANTLTFTAGGCRADNTDGLGLINDLRRYGVVLTGTTVLLLGAGGAARGVVAPLLEQRPCRLLVANRTAARAAELVAAFARFAGEVGAELEALSWGSSIEPVNLVVNATAVGLQAAPVEVPPVWVEGAFCYDMGYGAKAVFRTWAAGNGAVQSVDGLGMLVEQAAESFVIWHGVRPRTEPVLQRLRGRSGAG